MIDKVVVFTGSKKDFEIFLEKQIPEDSETIPFMELIQHYNARLRPNESGVRENALRANIEVDNCVVRADDYGSVMPHVLSNFANIVNLNYDMGTLYIQNPPRRVLESLKAGLDGDIEYYGSQYPELDRDALTKIYKALNSDVYGQDECKKQILSGMYRLTTGATNKPVVLMLYGPSGVGKTESAKSISKSLGGELLRIQFSMMQTSEAYDYVFGAEHSKSSFARDMMGRESNVILIDEFDKVNPALYNAFYELFDEGKYVDTNYSVELGQAIFLLTCNFSNENEIKKALGPAMFSRIGCCVEYADLTVEQKQKIVNNWYDSIMASLKDDERVYIETTDIHEWLSYSLDQIAGAIPNSVILKVFLNRNCWSCWMRIHRLLKSKQIKCHNAKTAASSPNGNLRYIQKLTARIFISTFRVCTKFQ